MALDFPINNADVAQVVVVQRLLESTILNVLHYQATTGSQVPDGPGELAHLAIEFGGQVGSLPSKWASIRSQMTDSVLHQFTRAQLVAPTRSPYVDVQVNDAGDVAAGSAPSNVALVVTKRGPIAGQGRTGSLHLAGMPISSLNGASWTAALVSSIVTAQAALLDTIQGIQGSLQWVPVINVPTGAAVANPWQASTVQSSIRVIRRRTLGVGI